MKKALALAALSLSGCMTMMAPAPSVRQDAPIPAAQAAEHEGTVRIVPSSATTGGPPMMVTLRAETVGMVAPLKFHWYLGNGREWDGPEPPTQFYLVGRYDVLLVVTDARGRVRKASLKVEAESHGC